MDTALPKTVSIYKPEGVTPLACVEKYRATHPELASVKLAYAGRLDPMAEGMLLILVGDECKNRERYEQCTKVYEITILLGVATDTGDTLGLVTDYVKTPLEFASSTLLQATKSCIGRRQQFFPAFSSKVVSGHPLFWWAREGRLAEITIPRHEIEIYRIDVMSTSSWNAMSGIEDICHRIAAVDGSFRQKESIKKWKKVAQDVSQVLPMHTLRVSCSSGTYMRELGVEIGQALGIPACVYKLVRTHIGSL